MKPDPLHRTAATRSFNTLAALLFVAGCAPTPREADTEFFGVATIDTQGRICLRMRSSAPGQPVAEGLLCYSPGDPQYEAVRAHVGNLNLGTQKVIQPFPSAPASKHLPAQ
jgi:hypothetical protein